MIGKPGTDFGSMKTGPPEESRLIETQFESREHVATYSHKGVFYPEVAVILNKHNI
jgi:hypothetical protein